MDGVTDMMGKGRQLLTRRAFLHQGAATLGVLACDSEFLGMCMKGFPSLKIGVIGSDSETLELRTYLSSRDDVLLCEHWQNGLEWNLDQASRNNVKISGIAIAIDGSEGWKLAHEVIHAGFHVAYMAPCWPGIDKALLLHEAALASGKKVYFLPKGSDWDLWFSIRQQLDESDIGALHWSQITFGTEDAGAQLSTYLAGVMLATGAANPLQICAAGAYEKGEALLTLEYQDGYMLAVSCSRSAVHQQSVIIRGARGNFAFSGDRVRFSGRPMPLLSAQSRLFADWIAVMQERADGICDSAFTVQVARSIAQAETALCKTKSSAPANYMDVPS